jgi:putative transposase
MANKNSDIMENLNYNALKEKALKQFRNGKSLFGQEGAFAPLLQRFIQEALEAPRWIVI